MRKSFAKLGVLLTAGLIAGAVLAAPSQANHQTIIGLTTDVPSKLAFFSPGNPGANQLDTITFPVGATDTDLVGIDYRPRANLLYGYGSTGILYVLRPDATPGNTTATQVNTTVVGTTTGVDTGLDFNPVADAIRVVTDTNENLRVSPDNGNRVAFDPALAFAVGDPNEGDTPDVGAAAYTNSFSGATATTLFDIEAGNNVLVRQGGPDGSPTPNGGVLTTIGPLGVDTTDVAGFDIETSFGTPTPQNFAYAALDTGAADSGLYSLDLSTGAATSLGSIAAGGAKIESIALPLTASAKFDTLVTQVGEGSGTAVVTVTRSGRIDRTASVDYSTSTIAGDNATSGQDFTPTSGTLTFPPNVSTQTIEIPITNDSADEPDESFQVDLGDSSSNLLISGANSFAKVVIVDNDDATPAPGGLKPLISVPDQSFRQALRGVRASFSCNRSCSANLTLFAGTKKVSSKRASLGDGGVRNVRFAIDNADRRLFRQRLGARGLKLTIKGVFQIPGGGGTVRRALTFRAHL